MINFLIAFAFGFAGTAAWMEKRRMRAIALFLLGILVPLSLSTLSAHADERLAISKLRASTVRIDIGSGFIAQGKSGTKYMITNFHVCLSGSWKGDMISRQDKGPSSRGKIVKQDAACDLCAVEVEQDRDALKIASGLSPQERLYTRGYPHGILTESKGNLASPAIWSYTYPIEDLGTCGKDFQKVFNPITGRLRGCAITYKSYTTDLYARPGSSGSPVVNDNGELVGVVSSWHPYNNNEAGMVPYACTRNFLQGL